MSDDVVSCPAGEVIDALGVTVSLPDDALPESAILLLMATDSEGHSNLYISRSDSISWVTQRGMIETARDLERCTPLDRHSKY